MMLNSVLNSYGYSIEDMRAHDLDVFPKFKIVNVTHLADEYDDEQLVELENGVCFIAKWSEGLFVRGQTIGALFADHAETQVEVLTMDSDGRGTLHLFRRL